jgi:hypothetical protein
MARRYIRTQHSGNLNVDHITRLFVETDVIGENAIIKASTVGPQMPFIIARCDSEEAAGNLLEELTRKLETE